MIGREAEILNSFCEKKIKIRPLTRAALQIIRPHQRLLSSPPNPLSIKWRGGIYF